MKVLLMSMPDCAPHFNARRWKPPNLAISSIAGNIEGHNIYIADLILRRDRISDTVKELIAKYQPDVVGCTAVSFQFATARKIASLIKGSNLHASAVPPGLFLIGSSKMSILQKSLKRNLPPSMKSNKRSVPFSNSPLPAPYQRKKRYPIPTSKSNRNGLRKKWSLNFSQIMIPFTYPQNLFKIYDI